MSRDTIDRCLQPTHFEKPHSLSTTKAGSLLKMAIPVRTWAQWDDARPGFVEIDLSAHYGNRAESHYLNSLTAVELTTGWTECLPIPHKT